MNSKNFVDQLKKNNIYLVIDVVSLELDGFNRKLNGSVMNRGHAMLKNI